MTSWWTTAETGARRFVFRLRHAGDPQILGVETRAESRFVVAGQDSLAVHLEHPAGCKPAEQRLSDPRRVDVSFSRKREGFTHRRQCAADHHLIADLADLTRTGRPDSDDTIGVAHGVQDWFDLGEGGRIAADHDREGRIDRADLSAAHGGIEHRGTKRRRAVGEPTRDGRGDAARVDDDRPALNRAEHAPFALEDLLDVGRVWQHRDDPLDARRDLAG